MTAEWNVYGNGWYALFVRTGAERAIQRRLAGLRLDGLSFHVPCREMRIRSGGAWSVQLLPMFPGYILANGMLTDEGYLQARRLGDVYAWIGDEQGPLRILPEEIALIRRMTDEHDVIRLSRVLYEGQGIAVIDGPLAGQEAVIRRVDRRKGRVKIAVSIFGCERLVDLSVEDVQGSPML